MNNRFESSNTQMSCEGDDSRSNEDLDNEDLDNEDKDLDYKDFMDYGDDIRSNELNQSDGEHEL